MGSDILPLHHDPHDKFRLGDERIVPRFHLEGVGAGRRVNVFRIDPGTGERFGLLPTGVAGDGGSVDLAEPLLVTAGDGLVAVPEEGT